MRVVLRGEQFGGKGTLESNMKEQQPVGANCRK